MSVASLLVLCTVAAVGSIAAGTAAVLVYSRRSKRLLEDRLRRLEGKIGELSALVSLQEPVFRRPLPWTSWTLSATCLLRIRESFAKRHIQAVVECGAGISTLHLGRFLAAEGGRLVSLEDDEVWAAAIRRLVEEEGLAQVVTVLHRPLVTHRILGREVRWYDVRSPADLDLDAIDLVLVDGPPGASGPMARLAALPVLAPALGAGAEIFLDDARRPEEQEILRLWQGMRPATVEVSRGARPYARLVLGGRQPSADQASAPRP